MDSEFPPRRESTCDQTLFFQGKCLNFETQFRAITTYCRKPLAMKETIHNEEMSRNSEYHDESDRESTDPTGVTGTESRGDRTVRSDRDRLLRERIVKSEERAVQKARLLVIATVVALTLSVSTAVYFFATKSDQASFELAVSSNQVLSLAR